MLLRTLPWLPIAPSKGSQQGEICHPNPASGDMWQCLETFDCHDSGDATSILWAPARDPAEHPSLSRNQPLPCGMRAIHPAPHLCCRSRETLLGIKSRFIHCTFKTSDAAQLVSATSSLTSPHSHPPPPPNPSSLAHAFRALSHIFPHAPPAWNADTPAFGCQGQSAPFRDPLRYQGISLGELPRPPQANNSRSPSVPSCLY